MEKKNIKFKKINEEFLKKNYQRLKAKLYMLSV